VIDAKRPELSPLFFQVDLAPPVLKFLCGPEGGCSSSERMKGFSPQSLTVQLWFLSILPLSLTVTQLRAMLHARKDDENPYRIPAHLVKDGLTLAVLAFCIAILVFCLQCLRVVWPRGFRGECCTVKLIAVTRMLIA